MEDQKKQQSEELDLGTLINKIGQGLQNGWMGFVRFLAMLRRVPLENRFSFLGIIVTSILIGTLYSVFLKKDYYETRMVLSCDYFNKRLVDDMVEKLNKLAWEHEKKGLAKVLNLPDTLADNIVKFEMEPLILEDELIEIEVLREQLRNAQLNSKNEQVIAQVIQRIEIENRHAFSITVRTLSASLIPNLQEAVVRYFRSNPYIAKRIEVNMALLEKRRSDLEHDKRRLDSLKVAFYKSVELAAANGQGSNNVVLSEKTGSAIDVYKQAIEVYDQLASVNKGIQLQNDFEIVTGFTEFSEPANPALATILLQSILVGIGIAYIEVALRSLNKYLAKVE